MNRSSIFFSITITFVALFIFSLISFGVLYIGSQKRENNFNHKRSIEVTRSIKNEIKHEQIGTKELNNYLRLMDFKIIEDRDKVLKNHQKKIKWKKQHRQETITRFELNNKNYLHIQNRFIDILLLDKYETDNFRNIMIFVFISILIAFTLLYLNTIRKLRPIKLLQESVKNIAKEEFDTLYTSDKKDEISQLAKEFNISAKKLKTLKESRNIFIRNIMHELKTPITKGQLLAHLPQTTQNKESMQKVFYRLESLINEFASIEELISTNNKIEKKEYFLSDIVDNAIDLLMDNEENIINDFKDIKIEVNYKLFSIAIKNLLDNGIKYSNDKRVTIKTQNSSIIIQSKGKKLTHPLQNYFEAFFKAENIYSNQSFGLGLYIVKHILDANNLSLEYEYVDGLNRFIIVH